MQILQWLNGSFDLDRKIETTARKEILVYKKSVHTIKFKNVNQNVRKERGIKIRGFKRVLGRESEVISRRILKTIF